jgi:thymidylate synthase (FAD)
MENDPAPAVVRRPCEGETVDLLGGADRFEVRVHDHGYVALVDVMPRLVPAGHTADAAVVQAARVSYGPGTKRASDDRDLVRYLMRHGHSTPFEMVELKLHVAAPLFVARQWLRHRTASVNEQSARYSVLQPRFYRPAEVRAQSVSSKQGSAGVVAPDTARDLHALLDDAEALWARYEAAVDDGVARELARIALPASVYTEWYWKCDLHNVLHFLELRLGDHAQEEIRDYARAVLALAHLVAPLSVEAFVDYRLEGLRLTRLEVEALRDGGDLASANARERAEWVAKLRRLGRGRADE